MVIHSEAFGRKEQYWIRRGNEEEVWLHVITHREILDAMYSHC